MGEIYTLKAAEIEVLSAAQASPNKFFEYFFRNPGAERAFQLDYDFTPEGKWQEEMCMATQDFIVAICGIGTGKTLGVGMSACYHGMITPYFKFMNVARESWQSQQMFEMIIEQAQDTPFEKVIRPVRRPYFKIDIEYKIGGITFRSNLQFMSLGEKNDATNIFTWRGDWVNIDEAWLIDDLGTVVSNLQTRLTGKTAAGRPYLGRMSLTSNPGESPELWQFYDIAQADTEQGLIFNIDTRSNRNVTEKQIAALVKRLSKDQQTRFLSGKRPEGRGTYFSNASVRACEDHGLSAVVEKGISTETPGFVLSSAPHLGAYHFQTPPKPERQYFVIGDPGTGTAPARNSPVLMALDATDPFDFCPVVAFWWGDGGNSILPFYDRFIEWIDYYRPVFAGVDNTGPQKNTAEIINGEYITGKKKSIDAITGLDFSGSKKYAMLVSLRLTIESRRIRWPHVAFGISTQLKNYDPVLDRNPNSKLQQDIVSVLAMASFSIRALFGLFDGEEGAEFTESNDSDILSLRHSREEQAVRIQHTHSRR